MEHKPCIYISGPMTGWEDYNFPAFNAAADALRKLGYPVINPADFGANPKLEWKDCLIRDLAALVHCDMVATLPGYGTSRGATLEVAVARGLGITVTSVSWLISHAQREADSVAWLTENANRGIS